MRAFFQVLFFIPLLSFAEIVDRCGDGYLEKIEESLVLHLEGSPYSRGYQHGVLLKKLIQKNIETFIESKMYTSSNLPKIEFFKRNIPLLLEYTPESILEEIKGLSDGSEIEYEKCLALNLFPELFHCSGIIVNGSSTKNSELYHVRALDYSIGSSLHQSATLIVSKPEDALANISVSYAGFVGCVTGMNEQKISLGEVGGLGYPHLKGMPMAFLMKQILEKASSLQDAKELIEHTPRTAEYYYLIADGKIQSGVGVYATNSQVHFIQSGENYALMAPKNMPLHYDPDGKDDKFFLSNYKGECKKGRASIFDEKGNLIANFFNQLKDTIIVTGFPHPSRFSNLYEKLESDFGVIDEQSLMGTLNEKTTLNSNLHNAIFCPSQLKVWISHANGKNYPAYSQPYQCFSFEELIKK